MISRFVSRLIPVLCIFLLLLVCLVFSTGAPALAASTQPVVTQAGLAQESGFDLTSFLKASVSGVPLIFIIIGMVYWFKQFKTPSGERLFSGNVLLLVSMGWGLLLGGGYIVATTRPPNTDAWLIYVYWFGCLAYALAMGIVASGLYNVVKDAIDKGFMELGKKLLSSTTQVEIR